ncbi:MetQ/NlpA family ABC transporter substrate-binding protein [Aestuariimicrobium sp. p3-SID1156]|uniref:MetQ/NlpA family ABC transporter substrate-binding protein n=1 Tax=Aestuariimicrobium sp. p3-SID1156 TaxID=2916038 RepID=UPI00223AF5F1|nr:MetQ/NlpA family ABC transporter substrate-binding protein [Aestuariimicrobium sp. p3-SID1156]MCT1458409.1 MetQ/NlpA family ABC transporter substrate-binding protein [Aestuariimicrobium sp. p3-SID1156]
MTKSLTAKVVALTAALALLLTGCGKKTESVGDGKDKPITIGVVGASQEQWTVFTKKAEEAGIKVEIKDFTDYTTENPAVKDGSLDANQFQHLLYLARYNKDQNADLVPIASTAIYPLALYSKKHTKLEDIPQGAQIAVPNDETNKSRALHVLAEAKLLKLKDGTGVIAAEEDIDTAASKVKVSPMDAQQTVTALSSIDGAVVNNDFVADAGLDPKKALFSDDASSKAAEPYINVFVVRKADANNETLLKLGKLFADKDVRAALAKDSGGSAVFVDKTPEELQKILAEVTASLK